MAFEIEKGVPMPTFKKGCLYPFARMEVGDSFQFPEGRDQAVRQAAAKHANKHSRKYRVSGKHLRCWRTA